MNQAAKNYKDFLDQWGIDDKYENLEKYQHHNLDTQATVTIEKELFHILLVHTKWLADRGSSIILKASETSLKVS